MADRSTSYAVAPETGLQVKSISDGDTAVANTPVGAPSKVVADACVDRPEVTDGAVARTT